MILKAFCTCRKTVPSSCFLMHVKLYCVYFDPLAVPVSVNQVMNLCVTNIATTVKINFIGSVQEIHICQFLKTFPVRAMANSTNCDNA